MRQEVKGVSTGAVALPGLFRSGDARPTTVKLCFADCGRPRSEDVDRVASELACGVYAYGALPWLSLESTRDRRQTAVDLTSLLPRHAHWKMLSGARCGAEGGGRHGARRVVLRL